VYSSIVVGTDGSATAQEAVRRAAGLATLCGARLSVVSAYRPVSADRPVTLGYFMNEYVDHLEHHLRQVLG